MFTNKENQDEGYLLGSPPQQSDNHPSDGFNSPEIRRERPLYDKTPTNDNETANDKVTGNKEFSFNETTGKSSPDFNVRFNDAKNGINSKMFSNETLNKEYMAIMSQEFKKPDVLSNSMPMFKHGLKSSFALKSS